MASTPSWAFFSSTPLISPCYHPKNTLFKFIVTTKAWLNAFAAALIFNILVMSLVMTTPSMPKSTNVSSNLKILWQIIQLALWKFSQSECRTLSKFIHEWLPLQDWYQVHSASLDYSCSSCHSATETVHHFLTCSHPRPTGHLERFGQATHEIFPPPSDWFYLTQS